MSSKRPRLATTKTPHPPPEAFRSVSTVADWLGVWNLSAFTSKFISSGYDDLELLEHVGQTVRSADVLLALLIHFHQDLTKIGIANPADVASLMRAIKTLPREALPALRRHGCYGSGKAEDRGIVRVVVRRNTESRREAPSSQQSQHEPLAHLVSAAHVARLQPPHAAPRPAEPAH